MKKNNCHWILLMSLSLLQGCVGYDRALFVTKTNVGIDIDTTPPTAEINVGRKEAVIEPTFADGETPPILGSFTMKSKGMFANVSSSFSGGDAAVIMATLYGDPTVSSLDDGFDEFEKQVDSTIHLEKKPETIKLNLKGSKLKKIELNGETNTKPFYFATDTSLGLKATWNATTGAVPDSFKFGFNRKEFALAPVFGSENETNKTYDVKMPSFLATVDAEGGASSIDQTGISVVQYFATGKAAERMALRQSVRIAMAKRMDPVAAMDLHDANYMPPDESNKKLTGWLYPNGEDKPFDSDHLKSLKEFLNENGLKGVGVSLFLSGDKYVAQRQQAVKELVKE